MKGIYGYFDKKKKHWVYIGKDSYINKNQRHKDHMKPSMREAQPINKVLQNNSNRYQYYQLIILGDCSDNELNKYEQKMIKQLNTYHYNNPHGLNFDEGGRKTYRIYGKDNPFYKSKMRVIKKGINAQNKQVYAIIYDTKVVCRNIDKSFLTQLCEQLSSNEITLDDIEKLNKKKMINAQSKNKNTVGIKNVTSYKSDSYKTGQCFRYRYYDENHKRKGIARGSLDKLERAVKSKGLPWETI